MVKESNGWIRWLVATLFMVIFTVLTTLATNVISNDRDGRARDSELEGELHTHVVRAEQKMAEISIKQEVQHGENRELFAKILTKLEYMHNGN